MKNECYRMGQQVQCGSFIEELTVLLNLASDYPVQIFSLGVSALLGSAWMLWSGSFKVVYEDYKGRGWDSIPTRYASDIHRSKHPVIFFIWAVFCFLLSILLIAFSVYASQGGRF